MTDIKGNPNFPEESSWQKSEGNIRAIWGLTGAVVAYFIMRLLMSVVRNEKTSVAYSSYALYLAVAFASIWALVILIDIKQARASKLMKIGTPVATVIRYCLRESSVFSFTGTGALIAHYYGSPLMTPLAIVCFACVFLYLFQLLGTTKSGGGAGLSESDL